jgi:hypothetical protein
VNLESHIARLEAETRQAQALQAEIRAERAYRAAGTDPARRAQRAAELHIARYRAAQEEEMHESDG